MKKWVEEAVNYIVETAQEQIKCVNACSYSDILPKALSDQGYLTYAYYPESNVLRLTISDAAKNKKVSFYSRSFVSGNSKFIYKTEKESHIIIKPNTAELVEEIKNNCSEETFNNMVLLLSLNCGIKVNIFEGVRK